jgi:predicted DNA-binding transcriptional regulator YafY
MRSLKVSRIKKLQFTDDHFNYPKEFSLAEYIRNSFGVFTLGDVQKIRVRFTDWASVNVIEQSWHPSQTIIEKKKDYVIVQFELYNSEEFVRWLLGYGRFAVVLEPHSLAQTVSNELAEAAKNYTDHWYDVAAASSALSSQ